MRFAPTVIYIIVKLLQLLNIINPIQIQNRALQIIRRVEHHLELRIPDHFMPFVGLSGVYILGVGVIIAVDEQEKLSVGLFEVLGRESKERTILINRMHDSPAKS